MDGLDAPTFVAWPARALRGGSGRARARAGAARRRAGGQGCVRAGGSLAIFIRLCRATDQGAAVPRQDRWRDRPCPISGQRFRSSAQAFARARAIGAAKSVSLKKTRQC